MTTTIAKHYSYWSLLAAAALFLFAHPAHAQGVVGETTFNFAKVPDVGAIGSFSADSPHDIWATAVLEPVSLHFDGTRLQQIPMANGSRVSKVEALSPTNVWAVGQQTQASLSQIQHFDGTKWSVVPSPHFANGEFLSSLKALSANNIFAVGFITGTGNRSTPLIEHFDGTSWKAVSVPRIDRGELLDIASASPSDIWAVGADATSTLTLHFDGAQWTRVNSPGADAALHGVAVVSSNDVWAVGAEIGEAALTEHWDGTAWTVVDNPSDINSMLIDISVISSNDIWAVGCTVTSCGDAGGPPLIEHFDGTQWNLNSAPLELGGEIGLSVLTLPSRQVFIGGFAFGTQGPVAYVLTGVDGK